MHTIITKVFLECLRAIEAGEPIVRTSARDKEFRFQDWFANRLVKTGVHFDDPARNSYPDFRLVDYPVGFEIKGLGFPGREANYDCNSQVPTGLHNGRQIYYVFGRYPAIPSGNSYLVYDLVICHGDFLNADHSYIHKNKNLKGFGSYGDIMIRDRKMYVAPTPYALTQGTERQVTLITPDSFVPNANLRHNGTLVRKESKSILQSYTFNLNTHTLQPNQISNPNAGKQHTFLVFQPKNSTGAEVSLRQT